MDIKIISNEEFNNFTKNHILKNFFQTTYYADALKDEFSYILLGAYKFNELVGAALILTKSISNIKYGYCPRGFIINYYDKDLLVEFINKTKDFLLSKGYSFIKFNPEVIYSKIDYETNSKTINTTSEEIIKLLKNNNCNKLKINTNTILPNCTGVINLLNYDFSYVNDILNISNKQGLTLYNSDNIDSFYNLVFDKSKKLIYYKSLFNNLKYNNMIDLLLVDLNYEQYTKYLQIENRNVTIDNEKINKLFRENPQDITLYNKKLESDKLVNYISSSFELINNKMGDIQKETVGCVLVIKYEKRAIILNYGCTDYYKDLNINEYIFAKVIEKYKNEGFDFIDFYNMSDLSKNDFRLKFNPTIYEYIGEYDFVINKMFHSFLWSTGKLEKEFSNKEKED